MATKKKKSISFEEGLKKIDDIIELLEKKGVGLEESISHYEEAMRTISECNTILDSIEGKLKKIIFKNNTIVEEEIHVEEN